MALPCVPQAPCTEAPMPKDGRPVSIQTNQGTKVNQHLTIKEAADGTATVCYDSQPIILLEPDPDPRDGEPRAWMVQGVLVKDMPTGFTPTISYSSPIRITGEEYMKLGMRSS